MTTRYLALGILTLALGLGGVTLADQNGPPSTPRPASPQSSDPATPEYLLPIEPNRKEELMPAPLPKNQGAPAPQPPGEEDMTVLGRGPVHEAYAQPHDQAPKAGPTVPRKPPPSIPEVPPDQKPAGDNVQWIPGYWSWDSEKSDFLWVSGFWRVPPPDRRWVPGHWTGTDGGSRWVAGFWAPAAQPEIPYQPEPPASLDTGPSVPGAEEDNFYVPGNWVYRTQRYMWRPGYWQPYRPGFIWSPAQYHWTPSGYVFVDGYWDYCLEDRGLLFAPVWFHRPLWLNPGWSYRPYYSFGIGFRGLFFSLFARPSWGHYYFGDYFSPLYAGLGFRPWYAYGRHFRDPLFGYYGWQNRGNPNWYAGVRDGFMARRAGELPRPPRTLAEQNTLMAQANRNANTNNLRILTPLNQVSGGTRLTTLTASQLAQQRSTAQQMRDLSIHRQQAERVRQGAALTSLHLPAHSVAGWSGTRAQQPRSATVSPSPQAAPIRSQTAPRPASVSAPAVQRSVGPAQVGPPAVQRSIIPAQVAPPTAQRSLSPAQVAPPTAQRSLSPAQVAPPAVQRSIRPAQVASPAMQRSVRPAQVAPSHHHFVAPRQTHQPSKSHPAPSRGGGKSRKR